MGRFCLMKAHPLSGQRYNRSDNFVSRYHLRCLTPASYRVVEACAIMLPPMGLVLSLAKLIPSGFATTWLVRTTATPNSSAILVSCRKNLTHTPIGHGRDNHASFQGSHTRVALPDSLVPG